MGGVPAFVRTTELLFRFMGQFPLGVKNPARDRTGDQSRGDILWLAYAARRRGEPPQAAALDCIPLRSRSLPQCGNVGLATFIDIGIMEA